MSAFVATSRPSMSPCGRYIASGFEDNRVKGFIKSNGFPHPT